MVVKLAILTFWLVFSDYNGRWSEGVRKDILRDLVGARFTGQKRDRER